MFLKLSSLVAFFTLCSVVVCGGVVFSSQEAVADPDSQENLLSPVAHTSTLPKSDYIGLEKKEGVSSCDEVRVHVRSLLAQQKFTDGSDSASEATVLDPRIQDLGQKLGKLHFHNFRLLSETTTAIPIGKRKVVNLSDGHKLALRPLYANDERVGVWIRWKDREGTALIDTRLHFNGAESLLTGVDVARDKGIVLAIQVSPIEVAN
ncbi:MAG: hypothetical protein KDD60_03435 [Bdellovibrionales bacterium]|nr:hypothetical protein [Bdellovibrionales bacterium]